MILVMLVSRFDFEFIGTGPEDVDPHSDQFIIGTKSTKGVIARATLCPTKVLMTEGTTTAIGVADDIDR